MARRITQTGKIPGMGRNTGRKLKRLSITSLPQVSIHLQARLKSHLGASGELLQRCASGIYDLGGLSRVYQCEQGISWLVLPPNPYYFIYNIQINLSLALLPDLL
jgi:nucleotidyltransferase/DNA polymerase involved in DNA repair